MTDNAFDPDDPDQFEIVRLVREANAKRRGYADFFEWPINPRLAEQHVAQVVCNFLVNRGDMEPGQLTLVQKDPPDVLCLTLSGLRIGIEATELISSKAAARARFLKDHGQEMTGLLAEWTRDSIAQELTLRTAVKDRKLAVAGSAYHKILLAVYTDELMIDEALAQSAATACAVSTAWISSAFLVLSYCPQADRNIFPDGYPIVEIPISRTVVKFEE
jgi:hypothetical protein